jgi:hypothetical protein
MVRITQSDKIVKLEEALRGLTKTDQQFDQALTEVDETLCELDERISAAEKRIAEITESAPSLQNRGAQTDPRPYRKMELACDFDCAEKYNDTLLREVCWSAHCPPETAKRYDSRKKLDLSRVVFCHPILLIVKKWCVPVTNVTIGGILKAIQDPCKAFMDACDDGYETDEDEICRKYTFRGLARHVSPVVWEVVFE